MRSIRLHAIQATLVPKAPLGAAAAAAVTPVSPAKTVSASADCTASAVAPSTKTELAPGETAEVPGSGSSPYTVKNCGGGVWSCTCIAWKMQGKKPTNERSCKHLVAIRGAAAEEARVGGSTASASSSGAAA